MISRFIIDLIDTSQWKTNKIVLEKFIEGIKKRKEHQANNDLEDIFHEILKIKPNKLLIILPEFKEREYWHKFDTFWRTSIKLCILFWIGSKNDHEIKFLERKSSPIHFQSILLKSEKEILCPNDPRFALWCLRLHKNVQMSNFWFDTISFNSSKKKKEGHQIELNVEQPIDCKLINSKVGKFSIPNQTNDGSNYFGSSHTAKEHLQKTIDISCFTKSSKRKFSPIPNLFPSFSTEHFKNWIGYQILWTFVLEWWMIQVESLVLIDRSWWFLLSG